MVSWESGGAWISLSLVRRVPLTPSARAHYEAYCKPVPVPGALQLPEIVAMLDGELLGPDAIITNGAGNYASFVHRFYRYKNLGTQLAPTSGSMGYGLPAAVAAKLRHPDRDVVCFAGDGCYMMHGQELMTAVMHGAPIIVLVVNNGMFGTIRMHQEREYPGRVKGTALQNPDFAAMARAYGGHGEVVATTAEFRPAWERAKASGKPTILELLLDPQAITPTTTLDKLRAASLSKHAAA